MIIRLINPIDWILRLAVRVAHRRWNDKSRIPDGIPGVRDIQNPCGCYSPSEKSVVLAKFAVGCQGDGHYLCRGCRWLVKDNDERSNFGIPLPIVGIDPALSKELETYDWSEGKP